MRSPAPRVPSRSRSRRSRVATGRVPPDERRRQLLEVAARLLTERGVEHVQITEVAERAAVSRPLVYRLFPTRLSLVRAVFEDFSARLREAYREAMLRSISGPLPGSLEALVGAFVSASCDVIEARGAGPWRLLDGSGSDPELAREGRAALHRVLEPWEEQLVMLTGRPPRRAASVMWIVVTAGRAAIDAWIDGEATREEAMADATRTISALLGAFFTDEAMALLRGASSDTEAPPSTSPPPRPRRAASRRSR